MKRTLTSAHKTQNGCWVLVAGVASWASGEAGEANGRTLRNAGGSGGGVVMVMEEIRTYFLLIPILMRLAGNRGGTFVFSH